jgi:hypothetical protein
MILQADIDSAVANGKLVLPLIVEEATGLLNSGFKSEYEVKMIQMEYVYMAIQYFTTPNDTTNKEKQEVYQCLIDILGLYDAIDTTYLVQPLPIDLLYSTSLAVNTFDFTGTGTVTFEWDDNTVSLNVGNGLTVNFGSAGFKQVRVRFSDVASITAINGESNDIIGFVDFSRLTGLVSVELASNQINDFNFASSSLNTDNFYLDLKFNEITTSRIESIVNRIDGISSAGNTDRIIDLTKNAFGNSGTMAVVASLLLDKAITVNLIGIPAAPSIFSIDAISDSRIDVVWDDNSTNEEAFELERSVDQQNWSIVATLTPNQTTYSDTGLNQQTTYYYRLRAKATSEVQVHYSDYSNVGFATTVESSFPITVIGDFRRVDIAWTDEETGEISWEVQRSEDPNSGFVTVETIMGDAASYTDFGLNNETRYYYRVVLTKSNATTLTSDTVSALTLASAFNEEFSSEFGL